MAKYPDIKPQKNEFPLLLGVSNNPNIWSAAQIYFVPVHASGVAEVAEIASKNPISIATFKPCLGCMVAAPGGGKVLKVHNDNYRRKEHFQQCQLVGLDIDSGMTIGQAMSALDSMGIQYAILTSKSHGIEKNGKPPCDRFRVLIPCEFSTACPITVTHNLKWFAGKLTTDRSCIDPARFFMPSPGIVRVKTGGLLYRWQLPDLDRIARRQADALSNLRAYGKSGVVPIFVKRLLRDGSQTRNSACYSIGKSLGTAGFSLDRIINLIMDSPLGSLGITEVTSATQNGFSNRIG